MDLSKFTDEELKALYDKEKEKENEAYQKFCNCAASKCSTFVTQFCESGKLCKEIKQEIRRRKRNV